MIITQELPGALYTAALTRQLDQRIIQAHGVTGQTLMQRAGNAIFQVMRQIWPDAEDIVILAGSGNNGGDGYVAAALAHQQGFHVQVCYTKSPDELQGEAHDAAQKCLEQGVNCQPFTGTLPAGDLYIDALLGTGLTQEVRPDLAELIQLLNHSHKPCLSVDVPSGLCADTGQPLGIAVCADATVTFIGCKQGLLTGSAPDYAGQLWYADLDAPSEAFDAIEPSATRLSSDVLKQFKPRKRVSHKGNFGHVLIVGGDHGMGGAVMLSAEAALRTGAGSITVATRKRHVPALLARLPEIMAQPVEVPSALDTLLEKATVVLLGPGLGQTEWGITLAEKVCFAAKPMVIDADALNLLAQGKLSLPENADSVLTPHPREAARLLKTVTQLIQRNRFASADQISEQYNAHAVLKGAGTVIATRTHSGIEHHVVTDGNPGMSSAGMGDVLSGIISGLMAQQIPSDTAAQWGPLIHALAGDCAARALGERGLRATDLMPYIHQQVNSNG